MRVAIIEKNSDTQSKIKSHIEGRTSYKKEEPAWNIDFYIDPEKFLNKSRGEYDLVLVDCDQDFRDKICFDFIHRISSSTDAELCILTSNYDSVTLDALLRDEHISGILDKENIVTIVEHIEYARAKINIKKHLLNESAVYATIANEMF